MGLWNHIYSEVGARNEIIERSSYRSRCVKWDYRKHIYSEVEERNRIVEGTLTYEMGLQKALLLIEVEVRNGILERAVFHKSRGKKRVCRTHA